MARSLYHEWRHLPEGRNPFAGRGKELAIQSFYASPGAIHKGESVQLCYGVANAKDVKLEPQPNPVWPSYSRCVNVSPAKSTTYTLTISDASGNTKTQSLEVTVK